MNTTRDTQTERREERERHDLREGQRARAQYRGGTVEGEILEIRRAGGATRVVLEVDDGTELDTDASRVEAATAPDGPRCPHCLTTLSRRHAYRCPACGADLVDVD